MTRTPYDQASKALLERALGRAGRAHVQHEVAGDAQWVDVWFEPDASLEPLPGLVGRMARGAALFEPFHDPPRLEQVRACLRKQLTLGNVRGEHPALWIVSAGRPSLVLDAFAVGPAAGWPPGVYEAPSGLSMFVVVVSELPVVRDTLLLRLMGAGSTLATAVRDVRALPEDGWEHPAAAAAVCVLRSRLDDPADEEIAMQVEETYEQWYQRVRAEGEARGRVEVLADVVLKILGQRFGTPSGEVVARVRAASVIELERLTDRALAEATLEEVLA